MQTLNMWSPVSNTEVHYWFSLPMFSHCIQLRKSLSTSHTKHRFLNCLKLSPSNKQWIFAPLLYLLHFLFCAKYLPVLPNICKKPITGKSNSSVQTVPDSFLEKLILASFYPSLSRDTLHVEWLISFTENYAHFFVFLINMVIELFCIGFEPYIYMLNYV